MNQSVAAMRSVLLLGAVGGVWGHDSIAVNDELGVPGYPDCVQTVPKHLRPDDVDANAMTLRCAQRPRDHAGQISIGCIGDSITAGVHSSGGNHTYPGQLQLMLDQSHPGAYKVTNLGACGSTMQKCADSPYWKRPQFSALTAAKWDIITIMLGTNDAKDKGSGHGGGSCGPDGNWAHNCTGAGAATCPFATDYGAMIDLVRTLGTTPEGPKVFIAIPPPLMQQGAYGMNQTVINDVFPALVPAIGKQNKVPTAPIDTFTALGGEAGWRKDYPAHCTKAPPPPPPGPAPPSPPVGTIGNGTCGSTSYGGDCNVDARGSFPGMKTLDACVAKLKDCKMAYYTSWSLGWNDCSWYSTCDWEHLCADCTKPGPNCPNPATGGCPTYHPFTAEVLKKGTPPAPPAELKSCALFCDNQSCDQCHPNDDGYTAMAKTFVKALGL